MTVDQGLAILGIAIAVIFGAIGVKALRNLTHTQTQKVSSGGKAIQSGRDTKIG